MCGVTSGPPTAEPAQGHYRCAKLCQAQDGGDDFVA